VAEAIPKLLFGDTISCKETADHLDRSNLWHSAIDVATLWKVIPRLAQRINALAIAVPSEQRQRLKNLSVAGAARSMFVAHRGATVLSALSKAGIPATAFKGVGLLANLYETAAARTVGDVDLLINEKDVTRTGVTLRELGFTPLVSLPLDEWLEHIKNRIHPTHGYVVFKDDDAVEIDIHWHLGNDRSKNFSTPAIIDRAEETKLLGIPIRAVAPLDAMMLTAHHTVRNYFRPKTAVKDLCDLSAWWRVQPEGWDIKDVVEYALDCGLSKALLGLWTVLADLDTGSPAVKGVNIFNRVLSGKAVTESLRLKDLFNLQLQNGAIDQVLIGILDFNLNTLKRFIAYETRVRTKKDSFQRLEAKKEGAHLPIFVRISRIIRSLFRLTPRCFAMYRTAIRQRKFFQAVYEDGKHGKF